MKFDEKVYLDSLEIYVRLSELTSGQLNRIAKFIEENIEICYSGEIWFKFKVIRLDENELNFEREKVLDDQAFERDCFYCKKCDKIFEYPTNEAIVHHILTKHPEVLEG